MIFHNSIPSHFIIMHNIIEVVAWSYATTFYLSADHDHTNIGYILSFCLPFTNGLLGLWQSMATTSMCFS
jgi:hypothetical protein